MAYLGKLHLVSYSCLFVSLKEAYDAVSLLKLLLACQRCTQQLVKIVVSAAAAALIHHTEHRVHI